MTQEDLEDWLADVIDDSIDMDWTGRVGARAIMAALKREHGYITLPDPNRVCGVCSAVGDADHAGYCSEGW